MGVVGLCLCLGAILVLPSLDARNVKLVPAETKTITTNGVTHEISRYKIVPDDESNGSSTDSITNEKIQLQIIPTAVEDDVTEDQSKQIYGTSSNATEDDINGQVLYETTKPEDIKTAKTPGLVKYHIVLGAHPDDNNQADYKVDAKILKKLHKITNGEANGSVQHTKVIENIPNQDSKTNVIYINKNNGTGKEHYQQNGQLTHTVTKTESGLNGAKESSKTETEIEFKRSALRSKKLTGDSDNSGRIRIKINNPTKITKINYSELPIKLGFGSSRKEDDHPLLASIGINKTFTLPGKRGRFKIIHEDDDEYEYLDTVLERPLLHQSVSKPTHQTITHFYDGKYIVDDTKQTLPDNVDEKSNLSYRLLKINTKDQNGGTIPTSEETYYDRDAVEHTIEKSYTKMSPSSESAIEINNSNLGYTNVDLMKSHTDTSSKNKDVDSEDIIPNFYYNIGKSKSVTNGTNEEPTFENAIVVNTSAQKSDTAPTLNELMKISSDVSNSVMEPRLEHTESLTEIKHTIENNMQPKNHNLNVIAGSFAPNTFDTGPQKVHKITKTNEMTGNETDNKNVPTRITHVIQTIIPSHKKSNQLNVLPLKNNVDRTYSSQIENIRTVNATNSKTTTTTEYEENSVTHHKASTVPAVVKTTTRTVVENEVPKIDDVTKFSESEKNDELTMPKINSEKVTSDGYVVDEPNQNHYNVPNHLGTKINNKDDENNTKVENVPIVEETIIKTIVENETPEAVDPNKFDSQKIQTEPSFDFNITVTNTDDSGVAVDEPIHNHADVENEKKTVEKDDNTEESVPIVENTVPSEEKTVQSVENTSASTLVENEVPDTVDPNKFSVLENDNEAIINENTNSFDSQTVTPSFDFHIPVPKIDESEATGEPKRSYANIHNYLGTINKNKVVEMDDSVEEPVPAVEEATARTIVENEVAELVALKKFAVSENDKKVIDSPKSHSIPSFDFNISVPKTDNNDEAGELVHNYGNVLNYLGTQFINKVAEKEGANPSVKENTTEQDKAMIELEVPKIFDADKVSVPENDNIVMVPKTNSQTSMTVSKNHTRHENTFDSKEIQKASSFDLNIPAPKTDHSKISAEPIQNYANVLRYKGTNNKNIHSNEYTKRKTVSKLENLEGNSSSSPIIKNVVQSNIPDNLLNSKHEITSISNVYHSNKKISSKSENVHSDKVVHTEDHHNIIAEPNIDNAPNTYVDFGSQTTFENNDNNNLEPLKDHTTIPQLQPQNEDNIGHNKLEITALSKTVPKPNIVQLTSDETKLLNDEHDNYSKPIKVTNQINNPMLEPSNVDLKFRLGKPNKKHSVQPTDADFTETDGAEKNPMHFEQFDKVSEPTYDSYEPERYPYRGDDSRSNRITYREELTQIEKEALKHNNNQYVNVPSENLQADVLTNLNYYAAGTNYPIHTYIYVPAYPYQVNGYNAQPNNANLENLLRTRDNVKNNQYLLNILYYLISSDLLMELKRKYATAGYGADMDAIRMAYIIGHLQNLGIYHKLSPEELQFLSQQIQQHENFDQDNRNKDVKHKIEIIYDIDDNQAASNQIINPNQNYVLPYANLYNGGATNEIRPLLSDAYPHRFLLDNFDVNTVNNAVGDLGTRVLRIVTYLRNLRLPETIIIQFIAEAKQQLTNEVLQTFATECQNRAYVHLGQIIDLIAEQVLQRCRTQCPTRYVTPYYNY